MTSFIDFPKRPGIGHTGRAVRVRANFFEVKRLPQGNIHHYDVTITPDVPPALNWKVFGVLERRQFVGNIRPVYDGRKNLFSAKPFQRDAYTFDNINIEDTNSTFNVRIKKVAEIYMSEVIEFINGRCPISNNILIAITALDVLLRHKPSMNAASATNYAIARNSFFTNNNTRVLSGGLEAWQGYYQSARPTPNKMMINIDLSATAFYEKLSLLQLVVKILNKQHPDDLRRLTDRERSKLEKSLKNLKINVTHRGQAVQNRRWKITGMTEKSASETFFDHNDERIDVATYFQRQYGRRLTFPFLPCVIVRRTNSLPIEVCHVVEGQRYTRKLDEKLTSDMIKFTCQQPHERSNRINQGVQILNYRQNEYMRDFGVEISTEMEIVPARVLPAPRINYHPSSREGSFIPKDGVWNLRDKKVATGATLGSWAVAIFGGRESEHTIQRFIRELIVTCQDTGMNIPNKTPPIDFYNHQENIEGSLKKSWLKAGNLAKAQPQLILCILPNTGVPLYAEIKRVSDTVIGVATQCIQERHAVKAQKQYCANVCLKINVKLGGMNSSIEPNLVPFITQRPTILMGADVTHPTPGEASINRPGRPSIASLCASMDAKASRYAASIRTQTARQEIIHDLAGMVKELLKTFYQTCGRKPDRILFYRDGVSEGQFSQVLEYEIKAIRAACAALEVTYKPTITFVVVQKRHHTRFFPLSRQDSDRSGNCSPGTVVETVITHPFEFDFYLQSHSGIQGTSRPAHYHVLFDENGFSPDSLQSLSYNLCYIYARCTRAVSRVPPVYYAHLVSSRARFHASGENWSDTDTSEGVGSENYAVVKADLQKVMYYM